MKNVIGRSLINRIRASWPRKLSPQTSTALVALVGLALSFQNCSPVNFAALPSKSSIGDGGEGGQGGPGSQSFPDIEGAKLVINDGAVYTNDIDVMLALEVKNADKMLVSDSRDCSGGTWEDLRAKRGWKLAHLNSTVSVYAKFKNEGKESGCIEASIIHDNVPPIAQLLSAPSPFLASANATVDFRGDDSGSGLSHLECKVDGGKYEKCQAPLMLSMLAEGERMVEVTAVDRAGNRSIPIDARWLVDSTKPVVKITKAPSNPSRSSNATFEFTVVDSGSKVDPAKIYCSWKSETNASTAQTIAGCSSPKAISQLKEGYNVFEVWATDRAGNLSDKASYRWLIDTIPPKAFDILGITGGGDVDVDFYLGTVPNPTIHWSKSDDSQMYAVSIWSDDLSSLVCASVEVPGNMLQYSYGVQACRLAHRGKYKARAFAQDSAGNMTEAAPYSFQVDLEGPAISISPPIAQSNMTDWKIDFSVSDDVSGVKNAMCYRTFNGVTDADDCLNLRSISYKDLPAGEHAFKITAIDRASNSSMSSEVKFKVESLKLIEYTTTIKTPPSKVDVLVVIDNSGSMAKDLTKLGQKLGDFTAQLGNLDWQICATTTAPGNDGKLIPFRTANDITKTSSTFVITKATPDYQQMFLNTMVSPTSPGSGDEQGIFATIRAVETNDTRCLRSGSAFSVVLISDEDELSTGGWPEFKNDKQYKALGSKNLPETAVATVQNVLGRDKIFTYHSIVIKPGDKACFDEQSKEAQAYYGRRYADLSALTNGVVGSICSAQYGVELKEFAASIQRNLSAIQLQCPPYMGQIEVRVNQMPYDSAKYKLEADKLKFDPNLVPGTQVDLKYHCKQ